MRYIVERRTSRIVHPAGVSWGCATVLTTLTLVPGSGLFRGTVVDPGGGRPMPFGGVIVQNQNMGSGYFLIGTQSGRVDLRGQ